jgi:ligand-binding sensor domain-containing protein
MKTLSRLFVLIFLLSAIQSHAQLFTNYTTSNGLPSDNVTGVVIDQNNRKWFGTQDGVARYNDTTWLLFTTVNGLIDNYINCIAIGPDNHIWVGTDFGISTYNGDQWTSYTPASGMLNDVVNCITVAPNGNVWVGTPSGASRFDGTTWKNFTTSDGLPGNMISSIAVETGGNVWFGTYMGGLSKFNGTAFTNFSTADSLPADNVITVEIGANNTKWIGTYSGVAVFDNNDQWVTTYRSAQGLFNNFVQDIAMDSKGIMWFGLYDIYTQDPGITWLNSTGSKSYSVADGLLSGTLRRIAIDQSNQVWIATNAGVSRLKDTSAGIGQVSLLPVAPWPNPAGSEFHLDGLKEDGILAIQSVDGKEAMRTSVNQGSNVIAVDRLDDGLYILKITTRTGTYTGKLLVR